MTIELRGVGVFCVSLAVGWGCGSPPPPAPAPQPAPVVEEEETPEEPEEIVPEEVDAGMDCVEATARCGGGVCAVATKNECEVPVTCELSVDTTCKRATDLIKATGRTRKTVNAGVEDELAVEGDCIEGNVVFTEVTAMTCR
jgi:hypothetical protein